MGIRASPAHPGPTPPLLPQDLAALVKPTGRRTTSTPSSQKICTLACSWNLHAGTEASISVQVHGTGGGCGLANVGGSFYDFRAERYEGTTRQSLVEPPDAWGGRALSAWARRLARSASYDPRVEGVVEVARTLDRVYAS